jgi:hypothetical protein
MKNLFLFFALAAATHFKRNQAHVLEIKNIPLPTRNTHAAQRACRAAARSGYARAA